MQETDATDLEPDDDVMFQFLRSWFSSCNHGVVELGWTDERTGKLSLFRRFALDDMNAATRFAAETNARRGCSLYFRPATVQPGPKYTTDNDVVQIPGAWADCDTPEAIARVLSGDAAPTFQVITGRIPSLRAQFLWKFSNDPVLAPEWSREINRRIHALAGGDPAVVNPSTLLRLPGSIAWPWKAGRQPELTEWIIPPGGGQRVSLATLQAKLPQVAPEVSTGSAATTAEILNPVQALIDQARAGPEWHNPVLKLVAMLVARGTPSSVILAMAEHLTWPKYTVKETREDLVKMIEGAWRKGFGEPDADGGGGDDADTVADVMNVPPKAPATLPLLTTDGLLGMTSPPWLLPGLVPANTLAMLYGAAASFKSFVGLDLALCLATGTAWYGYDLEQADTLYICGEGIAGMKLRLAAWLQHHGVTGAVLGFRVIPLAVNLMDRAEAQRVVLTVTEQRKVDGFNPKLVIIDTLHRCTVGCDENSAQHVGVVIAHIAMIQRELGCTCLAIHHAGKDAERGLRGSSGLIGAADVVIRASRADDHVSLTVEKQKDSDEGEAFHLRTQVVPLRFPGGIKPTTSLVLIQDADPPAAKSELSPTQRRALQYLADLIVKEGKPLPTGSDFPSPVHGHPLLGVMLERWQEECEARRLSAAEEKRFRKLTFQRVCEALLNKNVIAVREPWVWLP